MAFSGSAPEESVEAVPSQGECFIRVGWEPHFSRIQGGRHPEIQSLANRSLPLCLRREPDAPCREAGAGTWGRGSISRSAALGGGGEEGLLRKDLKTSSLPSLSASSSPKPAHHHGRPPHPPADAQAHSNKCVSPAARDVGGGVRHYPVRPSGQASLFSSSVVPPPLSRLALRRGGKMAAEKQVPGGGSGGGGSGGSGGGRGAGGDENKENERPSAGSKANKEFGDSLSLESILE